MPATKGMQGQPVSPYSLYSDFLDCGWDRYLTFDDFVDAHRGQSHALINDYRSVIDIHRAS